MKDAVGSLDALNPQTRMSMPRFMPRSSGSVTSCC